VPPFLLGARAERQTSEVFPKLATYQWKEERMARLRRNLWLLPFFVLCLALPLTGAQAQSDEAFVQYRQKIMTSQSASMGAINDILKNKLPYQDHIAAHARDIAAMSALVGTAFKKQIAEGKTDAKPEIWQEWEKFLAAAENLSNESSKLASVAQAGNMETISEQVKKVGGVCGDCHKPCRKPKEQSYKNQ
jgi:cytochrome c556